MKSAKLRRGATLALIIGAATLGVAPAHAITQVSNCPDNYSVWLETRALAGYCFTDPGFIALDLQGIGALYSEHWSGHFWYDYNSYNFYFSPGQTFDFLPAQQASALRIY
jgi:hypothetical protein